MGRARTGEAIPADRRTAAAVDDLRAFREDASSRGCLGEWRRAQAMLRYIDGERVVDIAESLDVGRPTINDWMRWYSREGLDGLRTAKPGRSDARLSASQRLELAAIVEAGPLASGLSTGMWTGKVLAQVILQRFSVTLHPQSVPRLLHEMGFSLQRPRKRLARADAEAQTIWVRDRFPELKKKPRPQAG